LEVRRYLMLAIKLTTLTGNHATDYHITSTIKINAIAKNF